jgi:hypothetical protein
MTTPEDSDPGRVAVFESLDVLGPGVITTTDPRRDGAGPGEERAEVAAAADCGVGRQP